MKPHAARPNPPEPTGPASFPDGTDFRARPPLTQPSRASPRSRDTRLTRGGFPPSRVATGHTTRKMRSRSNPPSGSKGRVCSLEPHFRVKLKPCTFPLKSLVLPSPTPTDGSRRGPPTPSPRAPRPVVPRAPHTPRAASSGFVILTLLPESPPSTRAATSLSAQSLLRFPSAHRIHFKLHMPKARALSPAQARALLPTTQRLHQTPDGRASPTRALRMLHAEGRGLRWPAHLTGPLSSSLSDRCLRWPSSVPLTARTHGPTSALRFPYCQLPRHG